MGILDSYIVGNEDIFKGMMRNLEVDNRLLMPFDKVIGLVVRSNDVIHRFSIPELNVKIDAIPGRLNYSSLFSEFPGVFFGQCSEICGAYHRFMPICVEFISARLLV